MGFHGSNSAEQLQICFCRCVIPYNDYAETDLSCFFQGGAVAVRNFDVPAGQSLGIGLGDGSILYRPVRSVLAHGLPRRLSIPLERELGCFPSTDNDVVSCRFSATDCLTAASFWCSSPPDPPACAKQVTTALSITMAQNRELLKTLWSREGFTSSSAKQRSNPIGQDKICNQRYP